MKTRSNYIVLQYTRCVCTFHIKLSQYVSILILNVFDLDLTFTKPVYDFY